MAVTVEDIIAKLSEKTGSNDITPDTDLFDTGILDSMSFLEKVIPILEDEYNIEVLPTELMPQNFDTAKKIARQSTK